MGVTRIPTTETKPAQRPLVIDLRESAKPLQVASLKLWQTDPKAFLEWVLLTVFAVLTFLGELLSHLPWGWYLVFTAFVVRPLFPHIIKRKKPRPHVKPGTQHN